LDRDGAFLVTQLLAIVLVFAVAAVIVACVMVGAARRGVESRVSATHAEMRRLADAAFVGERGSGEMRQEVSAIRRVLELLQARDDERREREEQAWEALRRVASVLTGSQRTGRTGENVLAEALSHLPPSVLERDFRVNGRVVEFALVLADGRRLPIDSKWPAERELALLEQVTDPAERDRIVQAVERAVARRAREVSAYRDPAMTVPMAVAAVPDAAYAVLRRAHAEAFRHGVVVVPYSLALPVALSLYALASHVGEIGDVRSCLSDLSSILDAMEATLENKLERASTMLANGTGEVRGQIGQARTVVTRARVTDSSRDDRPFPRVVEVS
jgi:hypothetical protein